MKLIGFILFILFNLKNLFNKKKKFINISFINNTLKKRYLNKVFIICLPGKSLQKHLKTINNYKNKNKIILTCNKANMIIKSDLHLFTNRKRFLTSELKNGTYLFSPEIDKNIINNKLNGQKYEYIPSINLTNNYFKNFLFIFKDFILTNNSSSAITAVCLSLLMGSKKIIIYGMDGYSGKNNHFYDEDDIKNFFLLKKREKINLMQLEKIKKIIKNRNIDLEIIK